MLNTQCGDDTDLINDWRLKDNVTCAQQCVCTGLSFYTKRKFWQQGVKLVIHKSLSLYSMWRNNTCAIYMYVTIFMTLFTDYHCHVFCYKYEISDKFILLLHNSLKLYCRYLYTRPCMINHIWGLKQLWLQVNGHAWFHLQRLRWPVRSGEGAKNSKWKYMSPAGFEPTPRQSTTGKLQRLRPLGHEGLMVISS